MVAWGPIIGAGISALGSLFGGSKEEKTTTTVDYVAMARAAEKAGFNPLTAIRNGGSAGFVTTTHPALSAATRFGNAFSTLGNALMSMDFNADRRAELENQMMEAQLRRITGPTDGFKAMMFGDVPAAAGAARVNSAGKPQPLGTANPRVGPTAVGGQHPYGEPKPLYQTVWWIGEDGKRYEQDVISGDLNLDDPSSLAMPAAVRLANEYDRTRTGPNATVQPNAKPAGPPSAAPMVLPPLGGTGGDWLPDAVSEWFRVKGPAYSNTRGW